MTDSMFPTGTAPTPWAKSSTHAPAGFFAAEAAGLAWLAETGTVPVVAVQDVEDHQLTLARLTSIRPSPDDARAFGAALAQLHRVKTKQFGQLPPGVTRYFFGPLDAPISLPIAERDSFGLFYAEARLEPLIALCRQSAGLTASERTLLSDICAALREGRGDDDFGPVRVHGDLWSGNIMWTSRGGTLIDPAACGHHPYADLAMLMMFGAPHLTDVLAGYESVTQLPPSWQSSLGLHQLFAYLVHLHLFGEAYRTQTFAAAKSAAEYLGM